MRQLAVLLVVLFMAMPADAQRRRHQSFAKQGDFALVVGVQGINVTSLQPVLNGIGARYSLADQTVLGTSVGFSSSMVDDERELDDDCPSGYTWTYSNTGRRTDVSLWLEQHLGRRSRTLSPFVG